MKNKLNILFPIETINRELDFRLFLATLCASRENRIFVGQSGTINRLIPRMKGGIFLGRTVFTGAPFPYANFSEYVFLKKRGFKLIHLSDEGGTYPGGENEWRAGWKVEINPNYLCEDDYICTWGEMQEEFYKSRQPACENNIHSTGHPRFDLYKPKYRAFFEPEANKIREKYGDFVLINTNLTFANDYNGPAQIFSDFYHYFPKDYSARTRVIEGWAYASQVLTSFIKLINRLSHEFPSLKFIIRPHPGEDRSFYETIFKQFDNVLVKHEGSVTPWLQACKLMIHEGCTTGVEAFLSGTPVIIYKTVPSDKHDIFISNSVGVKCSAEEQVIKRIETVLSGEANDLESDSVHPLVPEVMANFKQDCFQKMTNLVKEAETKLREEKKQFEWDGLRSELEEKARLSLVDTYLAVSPLLNRGEDSRRRAYRRNQFYGFEKKVIDSKMSRIQNILGERVNYKFSNKNLIIFEQE